MSSAGWIKLHRQIREHSLWPCNDKRPYTKLEAWIDLLLSANHKPEKVLIGNRFVQLERGQFITSQVHLGRTWVWNRKTVKSFFSTLREDGMLDIETHKGAGIGLDRGYTLITICNYSKYQGNDVGPSDIETDIEGENETDIENGEERTSKRTSTGLRSGHKQEVKECKEEEKSGVDTPDPSLFALKKDTGPKTESGKQIPQSPPKKRSARRTRGGAIPAELQPQVNEVVAKINDLSGIKFQANSEGTTGEIVRNLRDGKSAAEMILIAEFKWREWDGSDMVRNFNPTTLYRKKHFDVYLAQARAANGANGSAPAYRVLPDGNLELVDNRVTMSRAKYESRWGKIDLGGDHHVQ